GKQVLLLVDDIKILFKTLNALRNKELNFNLFKEELEKVLGKQVSKKYAEGYFYSATVFKLLTPLSQKGTYKVSATGILLCSIFDEPTKKLEYQKTLSALLLTNERKGGLFKRFLSFIDSPKRVDDIYKEFGEVTGKSLIIWSIEAGLAIKHGSFVGRVKQEAISSPPSLTDFWNELKSAYKQMQATEVFGMKRIFVDIGELRLFVSCKLNFHNIEQFDKYLRALLEKNDYGRHIFLHGAPAHILEERKDSFRYKNKVYLYLSIEDDILER
ncbi:MAG: hypothetical protein QXV01_09885, partial [Candidatus Bathyarchaeia archaeon]